MSRYVLFIISILSLLSQNYTIKINIDMGFGLAETTTYITKDYVVSKQIQSTLVYLKNSKQLLIANDELKTLSVYDLDAIGAQMAPLKSKIGTLKSISSKTTKKFHGYSTREIKISNQDKSIDGVIYVAKIKGLDLETYNTFSKYQEKLQVAELNLKNGEVPMSMLIYASFGGNKPLIIKVDVTEISKKITDPDYIKQVLAYTKV